MTRLATAFRWLGLGPEAVLPPRVAALVAEREARAEVLIGLIQVLAIAGFATLYAVARASNPPPAFVVEPVPVALALYAVATAFRLYLALRRRLTPTLLAGSVAIDIAVLMALIWSFHLQYGVPSAAVLKSPTLLYVFILIALRALRLDSRYVLLAGGTALLGYLVLVGAALAMAPAGMRTTHSFLEYVTSDAILLGAELDKLVSIFAVTVILAFGVARARRLLEQSATESVAAGELARFFAPEVAARIRATEGGVMIGMAERRQAAILVTDLRGFTRLTQDLEPMALMALLHEYQQLVGGVLRQHGGSIDKYLGDGILASFGAVAASETPAADALRAEAAIAAAVANRNAARPEVAPLVVGAAVAAGEVLFGAVGDAERLEYTVIGDAVNLASKLEKHNKREASRGLTDRATWDAAIAQGYVPTAQQRPVGERAVAGVPQPLALVVLGPG